MSVASYPCTTVSRRKSTSWVVDVVELRVLYEPDTTPLLKCLQLRALAAQMPRSYKRQQLNNTSKAFVTTLGTYANIQCK